MSFNLFRKPLTPHWLDVKEEKKGKVLAEKCPDHGKEIPAVLSFTEDDDLGYCILYRVAQNIICKNIKKCLNSEKYRRACYDKKNRDKIFVEKKFNAIFYGAVNPLTPGRKLETGKLTEEEYRQERAEHYKDELNRISDECSLNLIELLDKKDSEN